MVTAIVAIQRVGVEFDPLKVPLSEFGAKCAVDGDETIQDAVRLIAFEEANLPQNDEYIGGLFIPAYSEFRGELIFDDPEVDLDNFLTEFESFYNSVMAEEVE